MSSANGRVGFVCDSCEALIFEGAPDGACPWCLGRLRMVITARCLRPDCPHPSHSTEYRAHISSFRTGVHGRRE